LPVILPAWLHYLQTGPARGSLLTTSIKFMKNSVTLVHSQKPFLTLVDQDKV